MLRQLLEQSAIYTVSNLLTRGTLVFALVLLPLFLSPAEYGALGMLLAIAALVNLTVPLEVTQGLARFHGASPPEERVALTATAWWFTLLTLGLAMLAAFAMAEPLCLFVLGDLRFLPAFRIAIIFFALNGLFYFLQNQFRWEFRISGYVSVSLLQAVLTLGLSVALAATYELPLAGVVIGHAAGAAAAVAFGVLALRRSLWAMPRLSRLRKMLVFSLPLVPGGLATFASIYASRLILNGMAELSEVGIYTFASQIATLPSITIIGVQAALTPLVMAHHEDPRTPSAIARMFEGFVAIGVLAWLGIGLFAPELILHFGNPDYAPAGPLVLLLAPAYLMLQMYIFAPGFLVANRTMLQMWVCIVGGLAAVVASYLLIKPFGITGAAIANLAGAFLFIGLWFALSQRLYHVPIRWARIWLAAIAALITAGAATLLDPAAPAFSLLVKAGLMLGLAAALVALGLVPVRRTLHHLKFRLK
jgi:O-antigen/teichoic acid export membrane protein